MSTLHRLVEKISGGGIINREEATSLLDVPLTELCAGAEDIRKQCCGNAFDLCTIINGKSGDCAEDCKFCAQSAHHNGSAPRYPLLPSSTIIADARRHYDQGIHRFSIVTSGRRLSDAEVEAMCETVHALRESVGIAVCVSFGLLETTHFRALREAGVSRIHNNLETSRHYFPKVCTTHTFDDKVASIRAAQKAGLSVCSGGIFGIGEAPEDRIDMAFTLRDLGIKSVPLNLLNPIPGTPFADHQPLSADAFLRIVAIYRFILPDADLRLAGGRRLLGDKGKGALHAGANAAITGDMLTTAGISTATDRAMTKALGFVVPRHG